MSFVRIYNWNYNITGKLKAKIKSQLEGAHKPAAVATTDNSDGPTIPLNEPFEPNLKGWLSAEEFIHVTGDEDAGDTIPSPRAPLDDISSDEDVASARSSFDQLLESYPSFGRSTPFTTLEEPKQMVVIENSPRATEEAIEVIKTPNKASKRPEIHAQPAKVPAPFNTNSDCSFIAPARSSFDELLQCNSSVGFSAPESTHKPVEEPKETIKAIKKASRATIPPTNTTKRADIHAQAKKGQYQPLFRGRGRGSMRRADIQAQEHRELWESFCTDSEDPTKILSAPFGPLADDIICLASSTIEGLDTTELDLDKITQLQRFEQNELSKEANEEQAKIEKDYREVQMQLVEAKLEQRKLERIVAAKEEEQRRYNEWKAQMNVIGSSDEDVKTSSVLDRFRKRRSRPASMRTEKVVNDELREEIALAREEQLVQEPQVRHAQLWTFPALPQQQQRFHQQAKQPPHLASTDVTAAQRSPNQTPVQTQQRSLPLCSPSCVSIVDERSRASRQCMEGMTKAAAKRREEAIAYELEVQSHLETVASWAADTESEKAQDRESQARRATLAILHGARNERQRKNEEQSRAAEMLAKLNFGDCL